MKVPEVTYSYEAKESNGKWKIIRTKYVGGVFVKTQTLHKNLGKGEVNDLMHRYENNLPISKP